MLLPRNKSDFYSSNATAEQQAAEPLFGTEQAMPGAVPTAQHKPQPRRFPRLPLLLSHLSGTDLAHGSLPQGTQTLSQQQH